MNALKAILIFILAPLFLVMCKAPSERSASNILNASEQRLPSSSSADPNHVIAEKMTEIAGIISLNLQDQGNIKNQILKRFAATAKYYTKNYPNNSEYVLGLYQVYQQVMQDRSVQFFIGADADFKISYKGSQKNISEAYADLNQLAEQLAASIPNKVGPQLLAMSTVTYLRFFSNKISLALIDLAPESNANKNYVLLRQYFSAVQNQLAILSTIKDVQKLRQRVSLIVNSANWKNYQVLAKKTYVGLTGSSEIDASSADLDRSEAVTIGHRALQVLFKNIVAGRNVASTNEKFDFILPPESIVHLDKAPTALFKKSVSKGRNVASDNADADKVDTVLIGNIPGQYLNQRKNEIFFGYVEIKGRLIADLQQLDIKNLSSFVESQKNKKVIILKNESMNNSTIKCSSCQPGYDVIYPGFINLHNHTKQNNLPVWGLAKGQFYNRFEWRDWDSYTKSVSQNMNPWIQYGKPVECAAFRWSEMQAMINGTTYLQGPSVCVDKWGVKRVEDKDSYVSEKLAIQAPTDILSPNEMIFVWQTLKPIIDSGKTYEEALAQAVQTYCPALASQVTAQNVDLPTGLKILTNQKTLEDNCGKDPGKPLPPKFIRYTYWIHSGIAGKKRYLLDPKASGVIAHLAEGNRTDAYNKKEYEVLKLLGLNLPHINFVHGVGVETKNFPELAAKQIGLIWSPFSNLILYGETLDIKAASEAGVTIALGSDWLPTGSKGILEEVKLAAQYVDRNAALGYKDIFTDEYLFKMMTENPAKLINHAELSAKEAPVGRLQVGAMGSITVASLLNANPCTNIVRNVTEKDINLVLIDGKPIYGNKDYLDQVQEKYETISDLDTVINDSPAFSFTEVDALDSLSESAKNEKKLFDISKFALNAQIPIDSRCKFNSAKGFVNQDTLYFQNELNVFMKNTNLNLDRFADIQKLLAANLLNQSLNKTSKDGDPSYAVSYFPSLYSCNDEKHLNRFTNYVKGDGDDELKRNIDSRADIRKPLSGKGPAALAEMYK